GKRGSRPGLLFPSSFCLFPCLGEGAAMADAVIDVVGPDELPLVVELYNQIFRPAKTVESFRRRYLGRYNVLQMVARVDGRPVGDRRPATRERADRPAGRVRLRQCEGLGPLTRGRSPGGPAPVPGSSAGSSAPRRSGSSPGGTARRAAATPCAAPP